MIEWIGGALLGLVLAGAWGWGLEATWIAVVLGGGSAYLLSCAVFPYRKCPRCRGIQTVGDGHGNYRVKDCRACGGGRYVRLGARAMGRTG